MSNRLRLFILLFSWIFLLSIGFIFSDAASATSGDTKIDYSTPADGDDYVSTSTTIRIYFTDYLRENTIEDSIRYYYTRIEDNRGNRIPMSWSYDGRYVLTLTPSSSLSYDTRYYVYINDDIRDYDNDRIARGSFYFRTKYSSSSSDSSYISNVIERENPASDDSDIAVDTDVIFYFTKDMDRDTIDTNSVYLREYSGGKRVEAEVDYYPSRRKVVLTPNEDLLSYTRYEVVVTTRARDTDGNRLEESRWRFRTERDDSSSGSSNTSSSFYLISKSPSDNGYLADPSGTISFRFSKDARASTVNSTTVTLTPASGVGLINAYVSYNYLTREGQLIPTSPLTRNAAYSVNVTRGVKDTDGRDFPAVSWRFTVGSSSYYQPIASSISVRLNGQALNLEGATPYTKAGRVMVPFRPLLESTGAIVQYDAATGRIYASSANKAVELKLNNRTAYINGAAYNLDAPPETKGGRTMIPLRFAAEAMGYAVSWDPYGQIVSLTNTQ